jgi:hypothetical protein
MTKKKIRYTVAYQNEIIGEVATLTGIATLLNCSKQYVHKYIINGQLRLKNKTYVITDLLDNI